MVVWDPSRPKPAQKHESEQGNSGFAGNSGRSSDVPRCEQQPQPLETSPDASSATAEPEPQTTGQSPATHRIKLQAIALRSIHLSISTSGAPSPVLSPDNRPFRQITWAWRDLKRPTIDREAAGHRASSRIHGHLQSCVEGTPRSSMSASMWPVFSVRHCVYQSGHGRSVVERTAIATACVRWQVARCIVYTGGFEENAAAVGTRVVGTRKGLGLSLNGVYVHGDSRISFDNSRCRPGSLQLTN